MHHMNEFYDADYFENGIESGKSLYSNYRWIPELTIPMAMVIIDALEIRPLNTIGDFGCAKGFLVKAFKWLNRTAYGVDSSRYAIANTDFEVRHLCKLVSKDGNIFDAKVDYCIAKDVFEHIREVDLVNILQRLNAKHLFAIIPLGENGKFRASANNLDKSHVTCKPEQWWFDFFHNNGWSVYDFKFKIKGIKEKYYKQFPKAHGFFFVLKQ